MLTVVFTWLCDEAVWAWEAPFSASHRLTTPMPGVEAPLAVGAGGPGIWGVGESMHQCVLGWRGGWFVWIENHDLSENCSEIWREETRNLRVWGVVTESAMAAWGGKSPGRRTRVGEHVHSPPVTAMWVMSGPPLNSGRTTCSPSPTWGGPVILRPVVREY